jgi:virulence-associated protein VapD
MSILSLKRWERVAYEVEPAMDAAPGFKATPAVEIHMKLKRLKRHEAKPLAKVLVDVMEAYEKAQVEDLSKAQKAAILAKVYEVIPEDQLKNWFASCVKDVEGLEIDDEPVTTGSDLLDNADDNLLFWLLFRLNALSKLTSAEGNASASRSGSLRLVKEGGGSSPAASTDSEAGIEASTATVIPITPASSTGQ